MKNKKSIKRASFAILAFFAPSLLFSAGVVDSASDLTETTLGEDSAYTLSTTTEYNFTIKKYLEEDGTLTPTTIYLDIKDITGENTTTYYYSWDYDTDYKNVALTESDTAGDSYDFSVNYDSNISRLTNITANITNDFVSLTKNDNGGAIYNTNTSAYTITGDFVYNSTYGTGSYRSGGAIFNYGGTIGTITGNFIGNYATVSTADKGAQGGAIFNHTGSTIGNITGDFIGNYAYSSVKSSVANGGAITNASATSVIGDITGDFISNYASSFSTGAANGGAILNKGELGTITGDFIENAAYTGTTGNASGGAINNQGTTNVIGDFLGNYASAGTTGTAQGGAIYNLANDVNTDSDLDISVEGNFVNNYVKSASGTVQGGAVYNTGNMLFKASEGTSYFYEGNYAGTSAANGGFLYNNGGDVEFSVGTSASITIGSSSYADYYDSIAGTGTIEKTGAGTLTVNSSMASYTGSLTVSAGTMTINNSLGSTAISITQGAKLYAQDLAETITLDVYLSSGSSSAEMLSTLDSVMIDTLSIYLSDDSTDGDSIVVYNSSDITVGSVVVYDTDGVTVLDSDSGLYTFNAGTFTYGTAAVPEPSTYAMIFGVVALGFAYCRRRKQ